MIAEALVAHCPSYPRDRPVRLCIPGEVTTMRARFDEMAVVAFGEANVGAAAVLNEMCLHYNPFIQRGTMLSPEDGPRSARLRLTWSSRKLESSRVLADGEDVTNSSRAREPAELGAGASPANAWRRALKGLRSKQRSNSGPSMLSQNASANASVILLYLNADTFAGDESTALVTEVAAALVKGIPIALVHEMDKSRGACPFETIISSTPHHSFQ